MTPIGSTSSNIRRAIEFIVYSPCCRTGAFSRALTVTWTMTRRRTHRPTPPDSGGRRPAPPPQRKAPARSAAMPGTLTGTARSLKPEPPAACPPLFLAAPEWRSGIDLDIPVLDYEHPVDVLRVV